MGKQRNKKKIGTTRRQWWWQHIHYTVYNRIHCIVNIVYLLKICTMCITASLLSIIITINSFLHSAVSHKTLPPYKLYLVLESSNTKEKTALPQGQPPYTRFYSRVNNIKKLQKCFTTCTEQRYFFFASFFKTISVLFLQDLKLETQCTKTLLQYRI